MSRPSTSSDAQAGGPAPERWLPVVGWEDLYEVSDQGRVRSLDRSDPLGRHLRGRLIATSPGSHGYPMAQLYRNGSRHGRTVHSLVLEAFVGPRPAGADVCHCDGRRDNNLLSNLRWDTRSSNHADKVAHGTHNRGECNVNAKLALRQVLAIRRDPRPQRLIAREHGIAQSTVSDIKSRRRWTWLSEPIPNQGHDLHVTSL